MLGTLLLPLFLRFLFIKFWRCSDSVVIVFSFSIKRRVWRYHKGVIRIRQSKKNIQQNGQKMYKKDKQRSTKHTHKTKDRITQTPLKAGGEFMCSGRVRSSCSSSGTRHVNLVTNSVISHEWGNLFIAFFRLKNCFRTTGYLTVRFVYYDIRLFLSYQWRPFINVRNSI